MSRPQAFPRSIVAAILLAARAGDIVPPDPAPHVTITAGNEQSGAPLDTLALPLEIRVVNDEGKPVAAWLVPQAPAADADGRARAAWILGFESEAQSATANRFHATSASDSVVFRLRPLNEPLDPAVFQLVPVPRT